MTVLTFPSSPTIGQQYAAPNGIQYVFDGVKWIVETVTNTSEAISNSVQDRVAPMFVNGESNGITFEYDSETNTFTSTITNATGYVLPTATGSVLGGVKVGSGLTITNGVLFANDTDRLVSGGATLLLNSNNDLTIPGVIKADAGTSYIDPYDSNIVLQTSPGVTWTFGPAGTLRNNNSFTKTSMSDITTTAPTVVWTASEDFVSGVKLQIQVEANEVGDSSGWHSQVCEAIVASRGYANSFSGPGGDPQMTVYGVTHTSVAPLVTFTVQRNPTTKKIEVVGTVTAAATSANLRIYSVETATRD